MSVVRFMKLLSTFKKWPRPSIYDSLARSNDLQHHASMRFMSALSLSLSLSVTWVTQNFFVCIVVCCFAHIFQNLRILYRPKVRTKKKFFLWNIFFLLFFTKYTGVKYQMKCRIQACKHVTLLTQWQYGHNTDWLKYYISA